MPNEPGEIALSLSGGGTRALGFHLGTMDYLNRIGWMERVTILSSVSGGSLPAIGYAVAMKYAAANGQEFSFESYYQQIFEFFPKLNTVEQIFVNLSAKKPVVASGRRDLITGWSEVYRQAYFGRYFDDPSFDIFWSAPDTHLKEVIFNAAEFKTGVAFRFQYSANSDRYRIGNGNVWIDHDHAKQLRISDVMASSSCIPGGMEPLQFPQDYHWPDDEWDENGPISRKTCDEVVRQLVDRFGPDTDSLAIVDGGIYDNQTISSVLLALARAHRRKPQVRGDGNGNGDDISDAEPPVHSTRWVEWFESVVNHYGSTADTEKLGLYIISDVPLRHDPIYKPDPDNCIPGRDSSWLRRRTVGQLNLAGWAISLVLLVSASVNFTDFLIEENLLPFDWQRFVSTGIWTSIANTLSTLIPALLAFGVAMALVLARRSLKKKLSSVIQSMPAPTGSWWHLVRGLKVGNIMDMMSVRAASLSALVSRFYMHRTRQLEYNIAYSNPALRGKLLTNLIYELEKPRWNDKVSNDLRTVVNVAATMPTKIWVNEYGDGSDVPKILRNRNDLQILVAAGQATIIANLMRREDDEDSELGRKLHADWETINSDPFYFVDNR
jgi:predicted acylesterase/phospholipase RssA